MKLFRPFIIAVSSLFLISCTSEEGHLKKASLQHGQLKWRETLEKEARDILPESEWLRTAYVEFIEKKSEIEVEEVKFFGDRKATVAVVVTSYPLPLRRTLLKVAAQVGPDGSRRFNFGEALGPVAAQAGMKPETEKAPLSVYKYSKGEDDLWRLDSK